MTTHWVRLIGLVLTILIGWMPCTARSAQPLLSQYQHNVWSEKDGLLPGAISIAQTTDGYLWIGTTAGLMRFDGVRFVKINRWGTSNFLDSPIVSLFGASDGSLWVGSPQRLLRLGNGSFEQHVLGGTVSSINADSTGAIWFAVGEVDDKQAPLCVAKDNAFRCLSSPNLPFRGAAALSVVGPGAAWFGGSGDICKWTTGSPTACLQLYRSTVRNFGLSSILHTKRGEQWVGILQGPHPYGIGRVVDGAYVPYVTPEFDGAAISVTTLIEDADETIWIGTLDRGIYRLDHGRVDHFGEAEGLTGALVTGLNQDQDGTVWVTTSNGLDSFRRTPVIAMSTRQGLKPNAVSAVMAAADGSVWVSGNQLDVIRGGKPTETASGTFFEGKTTSSMTQDRRGRIWIGVEDQLVVIDDGVVQVVKDRQGIPVGTVRFVVASPQGGVWALKRTARKSLLFRIDDLDIEEEFSPDRQWNSLAVGPQGVPWLGSTDGTVAEYRDQALHIVGSKAVPGTTSNRSELTLLQTAADGTVFGAAKGLLTLRGGSIQVLDVAHGLPCPNVRAIVQGADRALWLLLDCGIATLGGAAFDEWFSRPETKVKFRLFDGSDGFRNGLSTSLPRASVGQDGRVWFSTHAEVQVIDPQNLGQQQRPPPVEIEEVIADRVSRAVGSRLQLPPRTRDIEIRYTALSFVVPRKVKFKYRLEGRDTDWTEADTRRTAFYTDLGPGAYRFHVIACNSDGVWNDTGASTEFEVQAAYYQTRWFAAACLAGVLSLLYLAYLYRLRQLAARYRDRLAAKYAERERIARDLHDTLLQSTEGMVLIFQAASDRLGTSDPARNAIDRALVRASSLIAEGRDRVQQLRRTNAETTDLVAELRTLGDALSLEHGAAFDLEIEGTPFELEPATRDEIYLILREGLSNAFQHAAAVSIEMLVRYAVDGLHATIRDDGHGIDIAAIESGGLPGHWGVKGMQERALRIRAVLEIRSRVGGGTEIELFVAAPPELSPRRFGRWFDRAGRRFPPGHADHPIE